MPRKQVGTETAREFLDKAVQQLSTERQAELKGERALREAEEVPVEPIAKKVDKGRFTLRNRHGWVITYNVNGGKVTLERSYRGAAVDSIKMSRNQARDHYRNQLRLGMR